MVLLKDRKLSEDVKRVFTYIKYMYEFSENQKLAVFLAAGILAGSAMTYIGLENTGNSQEIAEDLVGTLENQTGQDLELVNTKESNGVYEVNVKTADDQLVTYYVTQDGERFSQNMVDLQEVKSSIQAREEFKTCMENNNVTFYGNSTQQATLLQIQALGGEQTVSNVFQDVNDPEVLQEAVSRGIQRVPAFYQDGEALQGVNEVQSVAEFTGCEYNLQ